MQILTTGNNIVSRAEAGLRSCFGYERLGEQIAGESNGVCGGAPSSICTISGSGDVDVGETVLTLAAIFERVGNVREPAEEG